METNRREFLLNGVVIAGVSAVAAALTWIFGSVWTAARRFSSVGWIQVAPIDRFSPGTVTPYPEYRVAIMRTGSKLGAISMECTHLGCLVNVVDRGFFCPCHGSDFGPMGQVYSGPAVEPLPWYQVVERQGRLWVYVGEKLTEPHWFEAKLVEGRQARI